MYNLINQFLLHIKVKFFKRQLLFVSLCRSNDNDEATKKKVNLVFEKIQTLKSRATASTQGNTKVSS